MGRRGEELPDGAFSKEGSLLENEGTAGDSRGSVGDAHLMGPCPALKVTVPQFFFHRFSASLF